jgi:hypothetical protein
VRRLLTIALPVGLAVLAGLVLISTTRSLTATSEARLARARLKRDFVERAGALRAIPVDHMPEWQGEIASLSRWYFDELTSIRNRFPGEASRPGALEAAKEERKGAVKKEERDAIADFQTYAQDRIALLRDGKYVPFASALSEGLRMDLLAVEPGSAPGAGPGLKVEFALWGVPRFLERERSGDKTVTRTVVPIAFRRIAFQFLDGAGKPYGEMSGGGEPYQKLVDPERFVDDFPPGALFGTYWVELFPREAATVNLEVSADLRGASGAVRPATFLFKLPVPERWKLPPGAVFQAEIREAAPQR